MQIEIINMHNEYLIFISRNSAHHHRVIKKIFFLILRLHLFYFVKKIVYSFRNLEISI